MRVISAYEAVTQHSNREPAGLPRHVMIFMLLILWQ